ncbi:MAG: cation transporter, partial [Lacunisphaera sp.]
TNLALDAVPTGIDPASVRDFLAGLPGVVDVHHIHIWGLGTSEAALTSHVVLATGSTDNALLHSIHEELREHFGIGHATIQFEDASQPECSDKECHPTIS